MSIDMSFEKASSSLDSFFYSQGMHLKKKKLTYLPRAYHPPLENRFQDASLTLVRIHVVWCWSVRTWSLKN